MADFRDFISYELPEWDKEKGVDPERATLRGENLTKVESALEEITATPEGAELLKDAASSFSDGKVHILFNDGGYTLALTPNDFVLGTEDSRFQYLSPENGGYHDLSIQRILHHELQHIALGHDKHRGDEDQYGISATEESEAVRATNAFMSKYYGEAPRDEDTSKGKLGSGSPEWDFNENFKLEGYDQKVMDPESIRQRLEALSSDEIAAMGPEIQSLYEFRNHHEHFNVQYSELTENGSLSFLSEDLATVSSIEAEKVDLPSEKLDVAIPASSPSPTFG